VATYEVQNRVDVPLSAIPRVLTAAVVSTEDRHFFTEGALNPVSIFRAMLTDLFGGGAIQGGSTITQQYVKQAYLTSQRTLSRKLREAAIAVKLARTASKREILDGYLNTIYFGRGAYGVEAASEAYFGKPVGRIGLREASLLAGLISEPENADPARDPALARAHRDDTLKAMERDGKITGGQAKQVEAESFRSYVVPRSQAATAGTTQIAGDAYFLDAVHQQLVEQYGAQLVDAGGLRVTTTMDPTLQAEAYHAVYGRGNPIALDPARGEPAGALVSIDDAGAVRAMVGGQGYGAGYPGAEVNLALGAKGGGSGRQAGSTFKAFMLADVVRQGFSVKSVFPAPPEVVVPHGDANGAPWSVTNFEHEATAPTMSLVDATANSVNTVFAQVVDRLGAGSLDSVAESLGINPSELPAPYPSQVLGTADVSPLEMAAAYATFANHGVHNDPVLVTKVTTPDGRQLPLPTRASRQVLTRYQAEVINYVLQQVVLRGTGVAAGGVGWPVAGKTGTTDNSTDAWFIGYTPRLTTALWMGYPQAATPMVHFRGLKSVQGGTIPAQLWHRYMSAALSTEPGYRGYFEPVYYFGYKYLTPPDASTLQFPLGLGTTTTTSTTSTTSTTLKAQVSTTRPATTTPAATTPAPAATTSTTR
jgi:penicillin-binding protein 1A